MDIGNRIKFFREKQNITVNKLANMAGVSQSYLRDLELGVKQPTVEYLSYICDALGISLKQFFSNEEQDNEFIELLDKLNNEQRNSLKSFLETIVR